MPFNKSTKSVASLIFMTLHKLQFLC